MAYDHPELVKGIILGLPKITERSLGSRNIKAALTLTIPEGG